MSRGLAALALLMAGLLGSAESGAQPAPAIALVRPSILAIGTFQALRAPPVRFLGTGFVVGDGTLAATNAHVIPASLNAGADPELLVALIPGGDPARTEMRKLSRIAVDTEHDLALLKLEGPALRPLKLRDSSSVAEG